MRAACAAFSVCLLLVPLAARGQGFGVYEQGTCMMARGGTGVAEPCEDGSAVYINPAGLPGRRGLVISGGGTLLVGSSTVQERCWARPSSRRAPISRLTPIWPGGSRTGSRSPADSTHPTDWESSGRSISGSLRQLRSEPQHLLYSADDGLRDEQFVSIGAGVTIARGSTSS